MAQCVITGCGLDVGGQYFWGDLHEQGDQWIFNAVTDNRGEALKRNGQDLVGQKCLHVAAGYLFERRGLFVIPKVTSELSLLAQEYVNNHKTLL